jgi:hypothetical protein
MQKDNHKLISTGSLINSKVNSVHLQCCGSRILFAPANGKLYFGAAKIFPSHQNNLPRAGKNVLRSRTFIQKIFTLKIYTAWQQKTD